jgi:hypothetical protein
MNFTFNSQQYGTTVEISFEASHIDQIREMFDQFLRGSGFHFEDEEEEPQRPVKSFSGGVPWSATPVPGIQILDTTDKSEISGKADEHMNDRKRLEAIVEVVSRFLLPNGISKAQAMSEIIELVNPLPEKEWVGLFDDEIEEIVDQHTTDVAGYDIFCDGRGIARSVINKLKERNG